MPTIIYRGTRASLKKLLRAIPKALGGGEDSHQIARAIQLRAGNAVLSRIKAAFVTKAAGGIGDDGIKWKPLSPATIARRRIGAGDLAGIGIKGRKLPKSHTSSGRGLLTAEENRRWRQLFRERFAHLRSVETAGEALGHATAYAWTKIKSEGGQTRLSLLGGRTVLILRDTGELLNSLTAGVDDQQSGADGQIFRIQPGRIIVGTNKKPWHHEGIQGRLPSRPFWPLDGSLPRPWAEAATGAIQRGVVRAIVLLVEGTR